MRKRILITGHTGFIGTSVAKAIERNDDYRVFGMSRSNGYDLLRQDAFKVSDVDIIVHAAGAIGVSESWEYPVDFFQTNFITTLNVLEFARKTSIPVVYISSYMYGAPKYLPINESHPVACNNPYAQSKRQAELLCEAYARDFGLSITVLRPFNIYGPHMSTQNVIGRVIKQAVTSDTINVRDLHPCRDYLYIDDMSNGLIKTIEKSLLRDRNYSGMDIYNIGYGKSYSVQEIIDIVFQVTGNRLKVVTSGDRRRNEIMDCYADNTKFSKEFSWQPEVTIFSGIKKQLILTI